MTLLTEAFAQGTHAARPAASASNEGFYYYETDTSQLFQSTGSAWTAIAASPTGSSPLTTKGDLFGHGTADARIAVGSDGQALFADSGATLGVDYEYPPGHQFDYVEITSSVTITSTADGTGGGTAVIDGNSVTYDGSTPIIIEVYLPRFSVQVATAQHSGYINLYDGTTDLGRIAQLQVDAASGAAASIPILVRRKLTPSAASHTYHVRAWKDASADIAAAVVGAGGASAYMPGYMRTVKA